MPLSAQALWLTFHSCTCRQRDCDPCCLFGGTVVVLGLALNVEGGKIIYLASYDYQGLP